MVAFTSPLPLARRDFDGETLEKRSRNARGDFSNVMPFAAGGNRPSSFRCFSIFSSITRRCRVLRRISEQLSLKFVYAPKVTEFTLQLNIRQTLPVPERVRSFDPGEKWNSIARIRRYEVATWCVFHRGATTRGSRDNEESTNRGNRARNNGCDSSWPT